MPKYVSMTESFEIRPAHRDRHIFGDRESGCLAYDLESKYSCISAMRLTRWERKLQCGLTQAGCACNTYVVLAK